MTHGGDRPQGGGDRSEGAAEPSSLTTKILTETSRFATIQIVIAIVGWLVQIALARLLDRRDFGVFGICQFYIGLGQLLGDGGLGAALLRRRDQATEAEYRSTLTTLLAVAAAFATALFVLAPWLAKANDLTPNETSVLRFMAPLYFVGALRVVPYVKLERALQFSVIARIELVASLSRHVVALVIAAVHGGVWTFVWAQVVSAVVQLVLAYKVSPGWVGLGFSWSVFRPLVTYGTKVQTLGLFAYFKDNLSRALLGGYAGPTSVGIYDFGLQYSQMPVIAVNGLARVQLPVYAQLDARDPTLLAAVRGAVRTAMLLGVPLLGILALAGSWAVPFIYGDQWLAALPVVWGLLPNMVCGLVLSPLFTLLQGQGRAGLALVVFGCWTVGTWLLAVIGLILVPGSLAVVAWGQSIATVVVTFYLLIWATAHLGRNIAGDLKSPVIAGALALGMGTGMLWRGAGFLGHPVVAASAFLLVYAGALWAMERRELVRDVRSVYAAVFGKSEVSIPR